MPALLLALELLTGGTLLLVFGADWFLDGASDLAPSLPTGCATR
jgi:Ca2+/Na+ antiporter